MSLVPRRTHWSHALLQLGLVLLGLAASGVVEARLLVVRADGRGDVPTFQAGVDALLEEPSEFEPDTLRVEPGTYAEDVSMETARGFDAAILCVGGPDQTEVKSLRGFSTPIESGIGRLRIQGLRVRGRVDLGVGLPKFFSIPDLMLQNCRFMGDVNIPKAFGHGNSGITDCEFRARLAIGAAGYRVRRCRFIGQTARLALWTDFFLNVEQCEFSGADTAAVTVSNQTDAVSFEGCRFTDVGIGIAVTLDPNAFSPSNYKGVFVSDCRFENISGAAILVTPQGPPRDLVREIAVSVHGSRFENCGSAIDGQQSAPLGLTMMADTITASTKSGIVASVSRGSMNGVFIRESGGDGARLTLRDGAGIALEEWLLFGNHGDGLRLVDGRGGSMDDVVIQRNSSLANGGAGIRLGVGPARDPTNTVMTHNLVAGNSAGGLVVEKAYAGRIENNNAWLNGGQAFQGVGNELNLELDPQLCDPSGDDGHVATTSPCSPLGQFGQIGAFGADCDRMGVTVDALPKTRRAINPRSAAPVEVAILGQPLFDAHRVDASTVRVNGVGPSSRAQGTSAVHLDDVDRDGHIDLLLTFESRTLPTFGNQLVLEGQTVDGTFFTGRDGVTFKPVSFDTSVVAHEESPLTLVVPSPQRAEELQVRASAAQGAAATLEMFDVTGRRVLAHDLAIASTDQTVHLDGAGDLHRGIYMVRMSQRGASVIRRVVITH